MDLDLGSPYEAISFSQGGIHANFRMRVIVVWGGGGGEWGGEGGVGGVGGGGGGGGGGGLGGIRGGANRPDGERVR